MNQFENDFSRVLRFSFQNDSAQLRSNNVNSHDLIEPPLFYAIWNVIPILSLSITFVTWWSHFSDFIFDLIEVHELAHDTSQNEENAEVGMQERNRIQGGVSSAAHS